MKPCVIIWHKNGKWRKANKIFHTDEEINTYYARNRNRIGVLMIVKTVEQLKQLARKDPKEFGHLVKTRRKKVTKKPQQFKAQIRHHGRSITVLCELGHVLETYNLREGEFAGSSLEAALSFRHPGDRFDRLAEACQGAGHEKVLQRARAPATKTIKGELCNRGYTDLTKRQAEHEARRYRLMGFRAHVIREGRTYSVWIAKTFSGKATADKRQQTLLDLILT